MKKYEQPDIEIISLLAENIITTSPETLIKDNQTNDELEGPWA